MVSRGEGEEGRAHNWFLSFLQEVFGPIMMLLNLSDRWSSRIVDRSPPLGNQQCVDSVACSGRAGPNRQLAPLTSLQGLGRKADESIGGRMMLRCRFTKTAGFLWESSWVRRREGGGGFSIVVRRQSCDEEEKGALRS